MENNERTTAKRAFSMWIKTVACLLSILLMLYAVPTNVFAELIEAIDTATDSNDEQTAIEEAEPDKEGTVFEVIDRREETVKHFRTEDGSFTAVQYNVPVHEKDENGEWQDIDNTLSESGSEYSTSNARVKFAKKTTGNSTLFALHDGNRKITMSLSGARKKVEGQVTNTQTEFPKDATQLQKMMTLDKLSSKILYPEILDGVDLEYVVNSCNIKENIIVKERADSYSYTFEIQLNNLEAVLCEDGSVAISDPDTDEVVYTIPKGYMFDANGEYSDAVTYALIDGGNGKYALTVAADNEWINDEGRAFPVTIDPTVSLISNYTYACWLINGDGSIVDYSIYGDKVSIGFVQSLYFTSYLGFIPEDAYVTHASIQMTSVEDSNAYSAAYIVDNEWTGRGMPRTEKKPTAACWHPNGTNLSNNGYRFSWDLTDAVMRWRAGEPNYGVLIRLNPNINGYAQTLQLYTHNVDSSADYPIFVISYIIANGVEDYWSYATQDMGVAGAGAVNYATGELTFSVPTISASDYLFGYTPALVYQSSKAAIYYEDQDHIPLEGRTSGLGWHMSTDEAIAGTDGGINSRYADSDGTIHYIVSGKDEDGLGLSITDYDSTATITDRSLNKKHFDNISSDPNGFIALIDSYEDAFGNVLDFSRDSEHRVEEIAIIPNGLSPIEQLAFYYTDGVGLESILHATYDDAVYFEYSSYPNDDSTQTDDDYLREIVFKPTQDDTQSYSICYTYTNEMITIDPYSWDNEDISYGSVYRLSTVTDDSTGRSIEYSYDTQGRVVKITEYAWYESYEGQTIIISYGTGYTKVRTSGSDDTILTGDDNITTYNFDLSGRVVGVYSTDYLRGDVFGAASSIYENNSVVSNGIKTAVVTDGIYTNYLLNGGFDLGVATTSSPIPYWYTSNNDFIAIQYADDRATKEVKITPTAGSEVYFQQNIYLYNGDYTLSFDYTPAKSLDLSVTVSVFKENNVTSKTLDIATSGIAETVYDSLYINITTPGVYCVKFEVEGTNNPNAYVIFDNIRLEDGTGCGPYSMLQFGHVEERIYSNDDQVMYEATNFWHDAEGDDNAIVFESQLNLTGSATQKNTATQTVYLADEDVITAFTESGAMRSPNGTYVVSGFGQSNSAVSSNNGTFMIKVEVDYLNRGGTIETEEHEFPFLITLKEKQFVTGSLYIDPTRFVKEIRVVCDYSYQYGEAFFDDLSFIKASENQVTEYDYYSAEDFTVGYGSSYSSIIGMLKSKKTGYYEETYEYAEENTLINVTRKSAYINGRKTSEVEYFYYTDSALPSLECYTEYVNDIRLNEEKVIEKTYNTYGQNILTESYTITYNDDNTTQDSQKIRSYSSYYNASSSPIFGAIASYTDTTGQPTYYTYDQNTGRLLYEYASDYTGVYYTYDFMGRVSGVYPLGFVPSVSSFYQDTISESVEFDYDIYNELETIETKTTTYSFDYDDFGNTTKISAGNKVLAEYLYAPNNGKLAFTVYSNGYAEKYVYDHLDRLHELWYTEQWINEEDSVWICKYRYTYADNGNQCRIEDLETDQTTLFRYDANGKLLGKALTNDPEDTILYSTSYIYDDMDRMIAATTAYDYFINGVSPVERRLNEYYHYTETGELYQYSAVVAANSIVDIYLSYDELDRLDTYQTESPGFTQSFDYGYKDQGNRATDLISSVVSAINGETGVTTSYTYDNNNNITKITDSNGNETRYVYDGRNQLIREDNPYLNKTYVYTYDDAGNRISKKTYLYTEGSVSALTPTTEDYSYSTSTTWGDQLTNHAGMYPSYDSMGNPTYYRAMTLQWEGPKLQRMYIPGLESYYDYVYEYNADGIRTSKTVNGVKHTYLLDGTRIISEAWSNDTIIYIYDESGSPIGLHYLNDDFSTYYFEKNIFGDIVGIYNNSGTKVGTYIYDAWGNCTVKTWTTNATDKFIVQNNPFRYRGYYYDTESGLYYLHTRYYDPRTGRFISPDSPANMGTGHPLLGYNLYTYCGNNPVMGYDPMGTWDWGTFFSGVGLVVVGVTAVAAAGTVLTCSGTGIVMGLVASYTLVAGGLTAINGVAEIIEAGTDFNFVRDTVFLGSEELYEGVKNLLKTQAEIGTMICGAYITVNGGMVCFVAGTLVSTEEGQIRIEDIEPGMLVWATDPITGETALKPVVQTFVNQTNELVHVTVNGETITCTNEHPFYSPVKGWIAACQLRAGDVLVMLNGERIVVEQVQHELLESPVTVYNFEVADYHTYYVGDTEVLVHNSCRSEAVKKAWGLERENVMNGGDGITRVWTAAEKAELLERGKVSGYVGHHMWSVSGYPNYAGNPYNIQFLTRAEHFEAHCYNWRTITSGWFDYLASKAYKGG